MVLCWCYICNSVLPFLQIWWRNKLIYISDGLSVSKFLPKSSPKLQMPTIIVAVRCICNVMFNNKNISVFACAQWKSPSCIDHSAHGTNDRSEWGETSPVSHEIIMNSIWKVNQFHVSFVIPPYTSLRCSTHGWKSV